MADGDEAAVPPAPSGPVAGPRSPSPALRACIDRWIDELAADPAPGNWPARLGRERRALLLDGDDAYLYFLDLDGVVHAVDHDTIALRMEPVSDPAEARARIAAAVPLRPELGELLDEPAPA